MLDDKVQAARLRVILELVAEGESLMELARIDGMAGAKRDKVSSCKGIGSVPQEFPPKHQVPTSFGDLSAHFRDEEGARVRAAQGMRWSRIREAFEIADKRRSAFIVASLD